MQQVRDREGATPGTQPSALDDVLRELLEQAADIVEVDTAVVLLLGEEGRPLTATSDRSLEEQIAGALRIPVQRAQADGDASLLVSGITTADGLDPLLRANGIESLIAVPMLIDERIVGLLVAGTLAPRAFSTQETRLLQLFADRATLEVREGGELGLHRRAWTLQRSLLGEPFPEVPGLALAARYLPARASAGIGGGWYDVVVMRDGRAGLAIGDVASRGDRAAQLAAELRGALRAYAVDGDGPAVVASRMWHFVDGLENGEMATFLYALYDPAQGTARLYSAGHPAPLVVGADGTVGFAPIIPAAPLGVGGPPRDEETEAVLEPGATMLLYTEGLAERPGERLGERRARVAREARLADHDPTSLCSRLIDALLGGRRPEDDVALLAAQAAPEPDDALHRVVPAVAQELAPLRRLLRRWLTARGADEPEIAAITLAVQEACANAVEHAYGLQDDTFQFVAEHDGPSICITIRDHGRWRAPRGEDRGRGLGLMRALVDSVDVQPDDGGTTV